MKGIVDLEAWLGGSPSHVEVNVAPDDVALLAPASGTSTGFRFTHRHLAAGAAAMRVWLTDAMSGDDTWLVLAPFASPAGFTLAFGTSFAFHARLVALPAWGPSEVADVLRYRRPAFVFADGATMAALAEDPLFARADLSSVRAWITVEPLEAGRRRAFEELTGLRLCQGFAPPGAAGLVVCNPVNGRRAAGSIGLPLPGVDARILSPAGRPAAIGDAGRLELAGPNLAGGGHWLDTRLAAKADEAGYLYIVSQDGRRPDALARSDPHARRASGTDTFARPKA